MHTFSLLSVYTLLVAVATAMPAGGLSSGTKAVNQNEFSQGSTSELQNEQQSESSSIALQPVRTSSISYQSLITDLAHSRDPENGVTEVRSKVPKMMVYGGTAIMMILFSALLYLSITINKEGKLAHDSLVAFNSDLKEPMLYAETIVDSTSTCEGQEIGNQCWMDASEKILALAQDCTLSRFVYPTSIALASIFWLAPFLAYASRDWASDSRYIPRLMLTGAIIISGLVAGIAGKLQYDVSFLTAQFNDMVQVDALKAAAGPIGLSTIKYWSGLIATSPVAAKVIIEKLSENCCGGGDVCNQYNICGGGGCGGGGCDGCC